MYIHDGGLEEAQIRELGWHFPNATFVSRQEAEEQVRRQLEKGEWKKCLSYREQNIATVKLFDFFLLSEARWIVTIDPDVLFFRRPSELLKGENEQKINLYNRDMQYAYSMELGEIEKELGVTPPPLINSGLSRVARESIDFCQDGEVVGSSKAVWGQVGDRTNVARALFDSLWS